MLASDGGTTSLSNTSMEKVVIAGFLVDDLRNSPCGPDTGPDGAAAVSVLDDAGSLPPAILNSFASHYALLTGSTLIGQKYQMK